MMRSFATNALSLLLLTACSPYVYNQEIAGFGSGVGALNTSYQTGEQSLDALVQQQQQASYVAARTQLHLLVGCGHYDPEGTPPVLPACMVVPVTANAPPPLTSQQTILASAAPTFAALKTYADALTAVTNAADDTTLTQAEQSLGTAAASMAKGMTPAPGGSAAAKAAPPATTPSASLTQASTELGWAITSYLDHRRYAALRDAVPAANDAIQGPLSKTVLQALVAIRSVQLDQLNSDMLAAELLLIQPSAGKLSQADYQTKLTALQAKVAAFNAARVVDPTATVAAMTKAHQQLADALKNGTGQDQAILAAVQSFASQANQLKTSTGTAAKPAT